ncbi:MAG: response regulator [Candidatus Micrarchaeota archaeon]|nr:response regulator [Candidatus Micrarchaeota archaeon]
MTKPLMPEAHILDLLSESHGLTENELSEKLGLPQAELLKYLDTLKKNSAVESRSVGNTVTWYALDAPSLKKILIVEDDKYINQLIKVSLGQGYDVRQVYDGTEALKTIREWNPSLVVLDLMLPGIDGVDICQTAKKDPSTKDTIIVIVSARDATENRFKTIKFGADYYIKKPFKPKELRSLVNIFLRKKGRKFDALVELPDYKRLGREIGEGIKTDDFEVNKIAVANLDSFGRTYGQEQAGTVVRLVSQILQDKVIEWSSDRGFLGYIGGGEFIVGGGKNQTDMVVSSLVSEFGDVLPFIYQGECAVDLSLDNIFESALPPDHLSIRSAVMSSSDIKHKEEKLAEDKKMPDSIGKYTYEQLREFFGASGMDVSITRGSGGVRVSLSKGSGKARE